MKELRELFLLIVNMSITAGLLVPLILIARAVLSKAPKSFSYVLWGIVGFRLICPISFSSVFSVFSLPVVKENVSFENIKVADGTLNAQVMSVPKTFSGTVQKVGDVTGNSMGVVEILAVIWVIGIVAFLIYESVSWMKLKKQVSQAVKYRDDIYECDRISTPFVMGIWKPRIYIPFRLSEEERKYVLLHEQYHMKRKDYLVKFLAVVLLTIYWFQPLIWVAFWGMSRDMEMSCDEWVLRELGDTVKTNYSDSLLAFAVGRKVPVISPLAFGESSVKTRIKNVLKFKKCGKMALAGAVLVCVVVTACGMTNGKGGIKPVSSKKEQSLAQELYEEKVQYIGGASDVGKLLGILDVGSLGHYTMELQTSTKPYGLEVVFEEKEMIADLGEFDSEMQRINIEMQKNAVILLALIENAGEIQWSYGPYHWYYNMESANDLLEVDDVKVFAESEESVQELLTKLEDVYASMGEGVVKTKAGYQTPNGETYQYRLVLSGRNSNAAIDSTYVVYTDIEGLTFEDVSNYFFSDMWFGDKMTEEMKNAMYVNFLESPYYIETK